jgi:hypothetical protein
MYSKVKIFNLALGALLLTRNLTDTTVDASNEGRTLKLHWDIALRSALEDMDLDSTSTQANLSLVATDPVHGWRFAYLYPKDCAFFRRILVHNHHLQAEPESRYNNEPKHVCMFNNQKVIMAHKECAIGEYIQTDFPLTSLSATVGMAIAYRLAILSAPLIVGKGATALRKEIASLYVTTKAEAQQQDQRENHRWIDPALESELVAVRTS